MSSRAEAVPLITQDEETGEYVVPEASYEVLKDIAAPVAVVAIAGLWRTGKSYLLNHLSGAATDGSGKGFDVGATVNACTKGLWLWGEPVTLEDGLTVLFVDTEGLGSTSRTQTEDSQIFSLALLLSSLFVWNSRGVIDGNALEDFALVVNLTKHIHVRSNAGGKATGVDAPSKKPPSAQKTTGGVSSELEALAEHFPAFMWVVRDFTLRLEDQGRKINDRQYLENALKPQNSFSSEGASRNQIRNLLGTFFRERDCVTLVRPAEDEETLRHLNKVPFTALRPEFQKGMTTLKQKVYASLRPKAVNGRALTGKMLSTLAQTYVDALNSGKVPTISTAWDRVLKNQASEAVAKALATYDESLVQTLLGHERAKRLLSDTKRALHAVASTLRDDDDTDLGRDLRQAEKKTSRRRFGKSSDDSDDLLAQTAVSLAAPGLPVEEAACLSAHEAAALGADAVYGRAVWANAEDADPAAGGANDGGTLLAAALKDRKIRLAQMNDLASRRSCSALLSELLDEHVVKDSFKAKEEENYADTIRAQAQDLTTSSELRSLYVKDLNEATQWLSGFEERCGSLRAAYEERSVGPAKWDVYAEEAPTVLLDALLEWANEVGVRHRAVTKLVRQRASKFEEQFQTVQGELTASEAAVQRDVAALERAASESRVSSEAAIGALDKRLLAAKAELERHKASTERLTAAYDYAQGLFETQNALQKELFDHMRQALNAMRLTHNNNNNGADEKNGTKFSDFPTEDDDDDQGGPRREEEEDDSLDEDSSDDDEDDEEEEKPARKKSMMSSLLGSSKTKKTAEKTKAKKKKKKPPPTKTIKKKKKTDDTWDVADLGFEAEEMAEFASLSMAELKERIGEDEKELELMHEHAALTVEHAKVKKMLLADKDHELQEYEYQWGVAKANVAASEGELMVVDEELAVLKGTVLQMHRFLESRTGKLPADLVKSLTRDQRALLDDLRAAP